MVTKKFQTGFVSILVLIFMCHHHSRLCCRSLSTYLYQERILYFLLKTFHSKLLHLGYPTAWRTLSGFRSFNISLNHEFFQVIIFFLTHMSKVLEHFLSYDG